MSARGHPMGIRKLLTALIALAVLFAPAMTSAAAANAAVTDHQMHMMKAGYCKSTPTSRQDKPDGHNCCISMFLGLTAMSSAPFRDGAPGLGPILERKGGAVFATVHNAFAGLERR